MNIPLLTCAMGVKAVAVLVEICIIERVTLSFVSVV